MYQLRAKVVRATLFVALLHGLAAHAASSDELADLRRAVEELKHDYEAKIAALETRLAVAEDVAANAREDAIEAVEIAEETSISTTTPSVAANTFNPSIGVVLVARDAHVDTGWETIPGFIPGGEIGPGDSGFSLGESELNLKASIDDLFFGNVTLALEDEQGETEVSVEEAWIETTALPRGVTARFGRQFSGLGYLNSFHRHADDFIDRPLPYQAFLGGQYIADGVQLRWIAPTDVFVELGTDLDWGSRFPASGSADSAPDAWSVFGHVGGDIGVSNSWQAGMSYLSVDVRERGITTEDMDPATPTFTGDSDLLALDLIWKWAPNGNSTQTSVKIQGEFFRRDEKGDFGGLGYDGEQFGWYVQGVWQFKPGWRVGYRHDYADTDNGAIFDGTLLEDADDAATRDSLMVDWSHSEFSRVRFQFTHDQVLPKSENQFYVQYLMSVGAHGGHRF